MKISGFTFTRNVSKLYYPICESIQSILPIVDEFVVALGKGDEDDNTRELLESIKSPKIKIIETEWDLDAFPHGMEYAHQTDIAKSHCSGDWLFYIQADEVVHEDYLPVIKARCEELLKDEEVEGLLFKYKHFLGDYDHYIKHHGWYQSEIRIIKNLPSIHSFGDAQSFKRIENFDGKSYRTSKGAFLLNVASVDAYIYHYGWVRPPEYMQSKKKAMDSAYKDKLTIESLYKNQESYFDYGPLKHLPLFAGSHPRVMEKKIKDFSWAHQLNYTTMKRPSRAKFKHERWKYRIISFLERNLNSGKHFFGYNNWKLLKNK